MRIASLWQNQARAIQLWMQRRHELTCFEGMRISDLGSGKRSLEFRQAVVAAIEMVRRLDPRRFRRIQRHIEWIVNFVLPQAGSTYWVGSKTCELDFEDPRLGLAADDFRIGWCALCLIHDSTHGLLASKGFVYTPALRARTEALCTVEENRFLDRLALDCPELAGDLRCEFDESRWHEAWRRSPWQRAMAQLRRGWKR